MKGTNWIFSLNTSKLETFGSSWKKLRKPNLKYQIWMMMMRMMKISMETKKAMMMIVSVKMKRIVGPKINKKSRKKSKMNQTRNKNR